MSFIIDSSVALSWCFPDEATPSTAALYATARLTELVVPPLWHIEMANVLGTNLKRGRLSPEALDDVLELLSRLDIRTRALQNGADIGNYTVAMRVHQLTAYDATYLMLAQELRLPLATYDREMASAAHRIDVPLIQLPS